MGLFSRFTDIINANLNSMLDKAEHPEKMIRLIISEMEETLIEVRATAARNIAEQKTLSRKIASVKKSSAHWHEQAQLALTKGREDLAKSALSEKHKCQETLAQLNNEDLQINEVLEAIQADAQRLQDKLTEAKQRQTKLVRRQASAEIQLKVRANAVIHNIDEAMTKFERYQQKIDRLEAEVEAYDFTDKSDLNSQISALAKNDDIEAQLAAMKKTMATA